MSKRTPLEHVYYALKLYSSGLSLRKTSNILSNTVKRNHVCLELDSKVQAKEHISEEKKSLGIHNR